MFQHPHPVWSVLPHEVGPHRQTDSTSGRAEGPILNLCEGSGCGGRSLHWKGWEPLVINQTSCPHVKMPEDASPHLPKLSQSFKDIQKMLLAKHEHDKVLFWHIQRTPIILFLLIKTRITWPYTFSSREIWHIKWRSLNPSRHTKTYFYTTYFLGTSWAKPMRNANSKPSL